MSSSQASSSAADRRPSLSMTAATMSPASIVHLGAVVATGQLAELGVRHRRRRRRRSRPSTPGTPRDTYAGRVLLDAWVSG